MLLDRAADKAVLLSQAQAEAIGRLQLIQLVGLEIEKLVDEYRTLAEEIDGYEAILRDAAQHTKKNAARRGLGGLTVRCPLLHPGTSSC